MKDLPKGDSRRITIIVDDEITESIKNLQGFTGKLYIKKYANSVSNLVDISHNVDVSDLVNGKLIFDISSELSDSIDAGTYKLRVKVEKGEIKKTVFKDDIKIEL